MVDNIVSKPLRLVLIVTAHMVFIGPSRAAVTGIFGTNITFEFTFNISVTEEIAVYTTNHTQIAWYSRGNTKGDNYEVCPNKTSVFFHITNLKLNHSGIYSASLFRNSKVPIRSNNRVHLVVQEESRSSTVLPVTNDNRSTEDSGNPSFFSTRIVTVLVVLPVVLSAALLPMLIWCLVRINGHQQESPQDVSNPTVQETVEASNSVPEPSLVYSVLDFPKRSPKVPHISPRDTEYAAVSYLSEKRQV